jgi:LacI family transcriptional regulator
MKVPEDMGLASFDNTYIATLLSPNLTSVDYDYDSFGNKIIGLAVDRIRGQDTPEVTYIDSEVVVRDSCRN